MEQPEAEWAADMASQSGTEYGVTEDEVMAEGPTVEPCVICGHTFEDPLATFHIA